MASVAENNKRIAKNTVFLYIRMLFIMLVTLFTSRVVLNTLGVEDFGIFNVVGGIVVMMNVVNGAMTVSTQRYLTFELGKKDFEQFNKTFGMCMNIFILLCVLILVLGETVGLWFVNRYLVIPDDRVCAANWVYQFALLSCMCSQIVNPYNATIIAHERMNIYAYIGIIEVILKLAIVYMLLVIPADRLIVYGILTFVSTLVVTLLYRWYCIRTFKETKYRFYWDSKLFKQLASYSGWNLFGSLSGVAKGQGLNILINIFFGPAVNASRGIAYQLYGAVNSFFSSFYTAVRPQITKYYAEGNKADMFKLVFNSSKMSFFLILLISLPLALEAPFIINLWLGQLPEYVVPFVRIIVMISAIDSMSTPLMTAIHATGDNKLYQFVVGMIMIMTLPISYIFLKLGYSPNSVFIVSLVLSIISLFARLAIAHSKLELPFKSYTIQVVLRSLLVAVFAFIPPFLVYYFTETNWGSVIATCIVSVLSCVFFAFYIGLNSSERNTIVGVLQQKFKFFSK